MTEKEKKVQLAIGSAFRCGHCDEVKPGRPGVFLGGLVTSSKGAWCVTCIQKEVIDNFMYDK